MNLQIALKGVNPSIRRKGAPQTPRGSSEPTGRCVSNQVAKDVPIRKISRLPMQILLAIPDAVSTSSLYHTFCRLGLTESESGLFGSLFIDLYLCVDLSSQLSHDERSWISACLVILKL